MDISPVDKIVIQMHKSMSIVLQTGAFGLYVALQEKDHRTSLYLIYGTKYSFTRVRENEEKNIWPEIPIYQNSLIHAFECSSRLDYTPKDIDVRRDGGILICLWNNKV